MNQIYQMVGKYKLLKTFKVNVDANADTATDADARG